MIGRFWTREGLSSLAIGLFVVMLPFYWYRLPQLGNRSVIWLAVAFAALVAMLTFRTTLLTNVQRFIQRATLLHVGLLAYIFVYLVAALWGNESTEVAQRQLLLYGQFLLLGILLENLSNEQIGRTLLVAFPVSFLGIVAYSNWVFLSQGSNIFSEMAQALATGSHQSVTSRVVRSIVNQMEPQANGEAIRGSIRNFFGNYVCLVMFGLLAFYPLVRRSRWWIQGAVAGTVISAPMILLIVLMSRSAILSLAMGFGIAAVFYLVRGLQFQQRGKLDNMLVFGGAAVLLLVAMVSLQVENQSIDNLVQRFTEIGSDARVEHYRAVYDRVREHPWRGLGAAQKAPDGRQVHNYFLGAWYQVGIGGFLVTLLVWFGLCLDSVKALNRSWRAHAQFTVSLLFASALLAGPLFRRLISGDGGRFTLVELFAVTIFFVALRLESSAEREFVFFADDAEMSVRLPRNCLVRQEQST